jgi:DegV family protein with EDD domain
MMRGDDAGVRRGVLTALRCGLVVDGSAALVEDRAHGLAVVPLRIVIGNEEFVDDGHTDAYTSFYTRLRDGAIPITSTPAPGEYLEAFRVIGADHIVCLTIPAKWSSMYGAASLAAEMLAGEEGRRRVTVIETDTAIAGLSLVARVAAELCASGAAPAAVEERVRRVCDEVSLFGSLATLTYVARSGRVNALIAGVSNSLHVRPVFRMHGGETGRVALTRTVSGSLDALQRAAAERLDARPQWMLVFHADAPREAAALAERLASVRQVERCEIVPLSPIAGAYTGPGAFGFAALALDGAGVV